MIFKNISDFKEDLNNKILEFVNINNYEHIKILSIIKSYLFETKNIDEICDFKISYSSNTYFIYIKKNEEEINFSIKVENEIRKRKLDKLKNNSKFLIY